MIFRVGEILSKVNDRAGELVVPHHSVKPNHIVGKAGWVHPVCVHELDCGQTYWLYRSIYFLCRLVKVFSCNIYL